MLTEYNGNLFDSTAPVLGHGVNVYGKMGAGIAKAFSSQWPDMYLEYRDFCFRGDLLPGDGYLYFAEDRIIANIASQDYPGPHAKLEWLESGLANVCEYLQDMNINTIAIPQIGCGIGGLDWKDVKPVIQDVSDFYDINIEVWSL